jgi:hypothetical protein
VLPPVPHACAAVAEDAVLDALMLVLVLVPEALALGAVLVAFGAVVAIAAGGAAFRSRGSSSGGTPTVTRPMPTASKLMLSRRETMRRRYPGGTRVGQLRPPHRIVREKVAKPAEVDLRAQAAHRIVADTHRIERAPQPSRDFPETHSSPGERGFNLTDAAWRVMIFP